MRRHDQRHGLCDAGEPLFLLGYFSASLGRGQALRVQAGHAQCLVELAWAGAPFGGSAPPNPCQAAAECRSIGLLLGAMCCCGRASVAATAPGRLAGTLHGGIFLCGRALAAASGCRLPRHFFCSWEAQCNACGATARGAARAAYPPMARHGSPPRHCLLHRHWEKRGKEQKKSLPQQPALTGQGSSSTICPPMESKPSWDWDSGQETRVCPAAAHGPQKKTFRERPVIFCPSGGPYAHLQRDQ
jgi:hypothetical protein